MRIAESHRRRSSDRQQVLSALEELEVDPPASFVEFFVRYEGVFASARTAFELCALCDDDVASDPESSIGAATRTCRELFGLPARFLVISNVVANAVLVYDTERDIVFNMDFEAGDELLMQGKLEPYFNSFVAFLEWYFEGQVEDA